MRLLSKKVSLIMVRLLWEDRLLQAELSGYADYAR